jgi:hypothetical protein
LSQKINDVTINVTKDKPAMCGHDDQDTQRGEMKAHIP